MILKPCANITPAAVAQTINFLRHRYEFILVDLPPGLHEQSLQLISHSDYIYLVTLAEVSAYEMWCESGFSVPERYSPGQASCDFNRFEKRSPISERQIEKVIRRMILDSVHSKRSFVGSLSRSARSKSGCVFRIGSKSTKLVLGYIFLGQKIQDSHHIS